MTDFYNTEARIRREYQRVRELYAKALKQMAEQMDAEANIYAESDMHPRHHWQSSIKELGQLASALDTMKQFYVLEAK